MSNIYLLIVIVLCGLATFSMRALPFIIFDPKRGIPKKVTALGKMLPSAVMSTLIIYCLKDISLSNSSLNVAMILASIIVAITHLIKKNTILSICVGTICYMVLIRVL